MPLKKKPPKTRKIVFGYTNAPQANPFLDIRTVSFLGGWIEDWERRVGEDR